MACEGEEYCCLRSVGGAMRVATQDEPAIDAERAILAAMLLKHETVGHALERLEPGSFYRLSHRKIFEAISALFDRDESSDIITVAEELRRRGDLEAVGGPSALAAVFEHPGATANVVAYCELITEAGRMRRLHRLGLDIQQLATDRTRLADEVIAWVQDELSRIAASSPEARRGRWPAH
jgi:replicative DNA helicase